MNLPAAKRMADVSFGISLILLGALALFLAPQTGPGLGTASRDPGSAAFPHATSLILIAGGVFDVVSGIVASRRRLRSQTEVPDAEASSRDLHAVSGGEAKAGTMDAVFLLVAVVVYIPAIAWLGFSLSTILFCVLVMLRLGAGWISSLLTAFGLVVVIHVLFVILFRVQLPTGRLGLPW
jgi:hypothetical protein